METDRRRRLARLSLNRGKKRYRNYSWWRLHWGERWRMEHINALLARFKSRKEKR